MSKIYDFKVKDNRGQEVQLDEYKGKVILIVNTATGCGFTPQYDGLENLYKKFTGKGFEILDFPCNQFLNQAPGTNEELSSFCQLKFGTEFKTFGKLEVNGENASDLYKFLRAEAPKAEEDEASLGLYKLLAEEYNFSTSGDEIKWNFTKFSVDKNGKVLARFSPTTTPETLESAIENLL